MTSQIAHLFSNLEMIGLHIRKARIIRMNSGAEGRWHIDGSPKFYQCRLHIPLLTNPDCFYEGPNDRYHMPADGSAIYFVNTTRAHRAFNLGSKDRYHIVAFVWDLRGVTLNHRYSPENNSGEVIRMKEALTLVPDPRPKANKQ
jgi:hypothetical protein